MPREITLKIKEDGSVYLLHNDDVIDLLRPIINTMSVVRASDVELGEDGKWHIHERLPDGRKMIVHGGYDRRDEAIRKEIEMFTEKLTDPVFVHAMFGEDKGDEG